MNLMFYPKIALSSIKKNGRLYIPYIITSVAMVVMLYIINFLAYCEAISEIVGESTIRLLLRMGSGVIMIFSLIFLFYTNSFLVRRRKKEFGLYNILGMDKKNIGLVLLWESVIISGVSIIAGLIIGITFSKLSELMLLKLIRSETNYSLKISTSAIALTVGCFLVIFFLLFLNTLFRIRKNTAIELLKSENVGEKAPKANYILGITGVVILAAAYALAVSIKEPLAALTWFFVAVVMVIIGSYLIFIAGSVMLCRLLQKKKSYYYKSNHFISVSSMAYRMKRNGAGLASICILATMVLVMISSTSSLYFGCEASVKRFCPKDISINLYFDQSSMTKENISDLRNIIKSYEDKYNTKFQDFNEYKTAQIAGVLKDSKIKTDASDATLYDYSNIVQLFFFELDDYNQSANSNETLSDDEIMIYSNTKKYSEDTLSINNDVIFKVKKVLDDFIVSDAGLTDIASSMYIVVSSYDAALERIETLADYNGDRALQYTWNCFFNTNLKSQDQINLKNDISNGGHGLSCRSLEEYRMEYYTLYGSLFFLGILLSLVFIFATVLIVYYKQISEGYEDAARFDIMQKVGMTKREIKKSINSQLLTVFFLPLLGAGMHMGFAFPIIRKLLLLFQLDNAMLFLFVTFLCFTVFALFYTLVYKKTSNSYYAIVSKTQENQ